MWPSGLSLFLIRPASVQLACLCAARMPLAESLRPIASFYLLPLSGAHGVGNTIHIRKADQSEAGRVDPTVQSGKRAARHCSQETPHSTAKIAYNKTKNLRSGFTSWNVSSFQEDLSFSFFFFFFCDQHKKGKSLSPVDCKV